MDLNMPVVDLNSRETVLRAFLATPALESRLYSSVQRASARHDDEHVHESVCASDGTGVDHRADRRPRK
eukprot:1105653-Pleurochrysis_carterae.AAC.2